METEEPEKGILDAMESLRPYCLTIQKVVLYETRSVYKLNHVT